MRKNIVKLDNSVGAKPLHFIPYRQNFPVTVEAGSTLEFKSNDAATLLYYIKSVGKDRASIQSEFDPDPGPEPGELTAIKLNKKYSKLVFDTSYDPSADLATIYADPAGGGYGVMIVTTDWGLAVFDLQSQGLADSGYGMAMGETVIYSTVAYDDPVYHDHIEQGWQNLVNGELVVDATRTVNGIGQMQGLNPNASLWNGVWVGGVEAEPSTNYPIIVSINNGTYSGDTEISTDGTANVTLTADGGYVLPASITVSGASHTYDQSTGAVVISAPTSSVTITCSCEAIQYPITTSVTNGTYSGDTYVTVAQGGSVTITPASGYALPASVTVSGASYTYDSTTGVVSLSAPTGDVSIACVCEQDQPVTPLTPFAVSDEINAVQLNPTWTDQQIASYIKDNLDYRGNAQVIEVRVGGATQGLVRLSRRSETFGGITTISLFADNVWWIVWIEERDGSYTKGWQAENWTHGTFTWDATNKVFTSAVTAEVASVVSYANGYIYGKVSA